MYEQYLYVFHMYSFLFFPVIFSFTWYWGQETDYIVSEVVGTLLMLTK